MPEIATPQQVAEYLQISYTEVTEDRIKKLISDSDNIPTTKKRLTGE
jgi:hypothetical protein